MMWESYVPVGLRRAQAALELIERRRKGERFSPVVVKGRTIARSFWGQRWCGHLESFADYTNRLPRGRTYVRNGSVCHLEVAVGTVAALVIGSELYRVTIDIGRLKPATWQTIRTKCAGRIGSVLELLQGSLSEEVMDIVTDRDRGLLPKPGEIEFDCSCPDWASMCKHVAAVLYGIGKRLDDRPEDLFLLRGVDAADLIGNGLALPEGEADGHALADDSLADIFGIELDTDDIAPKVPEPLPARKSAKASASSGKGDGRRRGRQSNGVGHATSKGANGTAADGGRTDIGRSVEAGTSRGSGRGVGGKAARRRTAAAGTDRTGAGVGDGKGGAAALGPIAATVGGSDQGRGTDAAGAKRSGSSRAVGKTRRTGTGRGEPSADALGGSETAADIRITGAWLKRLRRRRRISLVGLAERVGTGAETVKLWEESSGEMDLPVAVRAQLIELHLQPGIYKRRAAR